MQQEAATAATARAHRLPPAPAGHGRADPASCDERAPASSHLLCSAMPTISEVVQWNMLLSLAMHQLTSLCRLMR